MTLYWKYISNKSLALIVSLNMALSPVAAHAQDQDLKHAECLFIAKASRAAIADETLMQDPPQCARESTPLISKSFVDAVRAGAYQALETVADYAHNIGLDKYVYNHFLPDLLKYTGCALGALAIHTLYENFGGQAFRPGAKLLPIPLERVGLTQLPYYMLAKENFLFTAYAAPAAAATFAFVGAGALYAFETTIRRLLYAPYPTLIDMGWLGFAPMVTHAIAQVMYYTVSYPLLERHIKDESTHYATAVVLRTWWVRDKTRSTLRTLHALACQAGRAQGIMGIRPDNYEAHVSRLQNSFCDASFESNFYGRSSEGIIDPRYGWGENLLLQLCYGYPGLVDDIMSAGKNIKESEFKTLSDNAEDMDSINFFQNHETTEVERNRGLNAMIIDQRREDIVSYLHALRNELTQFNFGKLILDDTMTLLHYKPNTNPLEYQPWFNNNLLTHAYRDANRLSWFIKVELALAGFLGYTALTVFGGMAYNAALPYATAGLIIGRMMLGL